jgi:two-component system chemotaxis sensor kinase CheA
MNLTFELEPGDDLVYVAEAVEQIERIERGLLDLEQGAADGSTLAEIFRAAHTLKGSAATIGHDRMAELTHALEEVFGALRSGHLVDLRSFDDLMLPTVDVLRVLVDEVAAGKTLTDAPASLALAIVDRLALALGGNASPDTQPVGVPPPFETLVASERERPDESIAAAGSRTTILFAVEPDSTWASVRLLQALMAATESGRLLDSVPSMTEVETGGAGSVLTMTMQGGADDIAGLMERLKAMDDVVQVRIGEVDDLNVPVPTDAAGGSGVKDPATRRSPGHTIRIEVSQLDDLMDLVGELIVQKTRLRRQAQLLAARLGEDLLASQAEDGARQFAQIVDRLQAGVTELRMLPIETVFTRFPRLVRDLSAQLGKDVGLTLEGQETELDRALLEEIGDPIGHLIRNALDHGIEPSPARIAAGKPGRGTIRVAARHADGRVIVAVTDDGRGMDPMAISSAALERGLVDRSSLMGMTDVERLRLVFLPGFSTAPEVTEVSGRGVGMDVVRTNVERLGGTVAISSTLGAGTTITMSLPLTLAIIEALLVRSGRRVCAIPLTSVLETQRLPRTDVQTVGFMPVLSLPRGVVPLHPLDRAMGDREPEVDGDAYVRAVLVRSRGAELALEVDAFLGTEEIVIKSLGLPGEQPLGVVGATILADGGIALVVDVDRLGIPAVAYPKSA